MAVSVRNDVAGSLYEAEVDGAPAGVLVYEAHDSRVALLHTIVDPAFQGQGVAGMLVTAVLDDLRSQGKTITVYCPYVLSFLTKHPDYADLVDADEPGLFKR